MDEIKNVKIPASAEHEGILFVIVKVRWVCPKCGGPRGKVFDAISYDGSRTLWVDGWSNPCGHIDRYSDVRIEAQSNGLN